MQNEANTATPQNTYTGQLADGSCVAVHVSGDRITDITPVAKDSSIPHLLPVLVDLQHNGALGYAYSEISQHGVNELRQIATFLHRHGVGRCLPTFITHSFETLSASSACLDEWLTASPDLAKLFIGIFHEGVYMSPKDGWRGVHDLKHIRPPNWDELSELDKISGNRIRIVNVAPEEPGGLDFIQHAVEAGKLVSIGHCCPNAETIHLAADRGATLVTHFGNGAAATVSRFDNPFWAILNEPRLRLGLIGDGFHLPPDLLGAAIRCKGRDACHMVSDAASVSACPPGRYEDGYAEPCVVEPNGHLHAADAAYLAGAWFQLDRSVEWLVETLGMTLREAWRQCSEVPASIIGESLPDITIGAEASFVLAHWDDGLVLDQSIHNGTPYLNSPIRPTDCKQS